MMKQVPQCKFLFIYYYLHYPSDVSDQTPLRRACRWGHGAVAKVLLDHGARVNIKYVISILEVDKFNMSGIPPNGTVILILLFF